MKNLRIMIITVLLFSTIGLVSQPPPVDCDSDPCYQTQSWVSKQVTFQFGPLPDCDDCWVEIHYKTRDNSTSTECNHLPAVEYQLEFVIVSGGCYYPPCNYFTAFDMEEAYNQAMIKFLDYLGYGITWPDDCGPILESFTITNCFRQDVDTEGNQILRVCNAKTCCKQDLQLCVENGMVEINSTIDSDAGDCSNDPFHPTECETICNWIDEALVPKEVLKGKGEVIFNKLTISPNPVSSSSLNYNLDSKDKIVEIVIIDPVGKLIKINELNKNGSNTINTSEFPSGNYILMLRTDKNETHYSKFNIVK